jgi:hypothetical protein
MKKTIFLLVTLINFSVFSQKVEFSKYFKTAKKLNIENFDPYMQQVFGVKVMDLKDTGKYDLYQDIFENKMAVALIPISENLKIQSTDDLGIFNEYNQKLKSDTAFERANFNPFKYNLDFYSSQPIAYRIGKTDYVLIILPQ